MERHKKALHRGFLGSDTITVYDTVMTDTFIIQLPKPIELATQRMDPKVNSGLELIIMYQYEHINCNKCPTRKQDVTHSGKLKRQARDVYGNCTFC